MNICLCSLILHKKSAALMLRLIQPVMCLSPVQVFIMDT